MLHSGMSQDGSAALGQGGFVCSHGTPSPAWQGHPKPTQLQVGLPVGCGSLAAGGEVGQGLRRRRREVRKALHGVALPVALQLQFLPLPWVLRVGLNLRRWLVWKKGRGKVW